MDDKRIMYVPQWAEYLFLFLFLLSISIVVPKFLFGYATRVWQGLLFAWGGTLAYYLWDRTTNIGGEKIDREYTQIVKCGKGRRR